VRRWFRLLIATRRVRILIAPATSKPTLESSLVLNGSTYVDPPTMRFVLTMNAERDKGACEKSKDNGPDCIPVRTDGVYGAAVTRRLRAMGIRDKPIAPGSRWQNGFAERLIGSIRRECVDHIVAWARNTCVGSSNPTRAILQWIADASCLTKDAPIIEQSRASVPSSHDQFSTASLPILQNLGLRYTQVAPRGNEDGFLHQATSIPRVIQLAESRNNRRRLLGCREIKCSNSTPSR
jgi:hypothetical protein